MKRPGYRTSFLIASLISERSQQLTTPARSSRKAFVSRQKVLWGAVQIQVNYRVRRFRNPIILGCVAKVAQASQFAAITYNAV